MQRGPAFLALILLGAAGDPQGAIATLSAGPPLSSSGSVETTGNAQSGVSVAQSATTEEQRLREEYIRRALQAQTDPALAGRKERSTGTGFYVAEHFLLTNYHVIRDCTVSTAQSAEEGTVPAVVSVAAADQAHDLALLRSTQAAQGQAVLEAVPVRVDGSDLYIVGYPAHGMVLRRPNLTQAVASPAALATTDALFQVAAEVHPGHSGSPLLDEYGAVVGVITRVVDSVTTYKNTGKLFKNVGLAIPSRVVSEFLRAHSVPYTAATPSTSLTLPDRWARARAFIAQVSCWQ